MVARSKRLKVTFGIRGMSYRSPRWRIRLFILSSSLVWVSFVSSNPPSTYSYQFVGTFSCAQIDLRKARERTRVSKTLDEKSTSNGIAEPYATKIKGKSRGGEGTTPITTACPEAGKKMCGKKYVYTSFITR